MRLRILLAAGLAVPLMASSAGAQTPGQWRFSAAIGAPTTVLKAGSLSVKLGVGEGVEAGRTFRSRGPSRGVLLVRLYTAPVNGSGPGSDWTPGRATIADLSVQVDRSVGARTGLFGGVGISHWSGPSTTAPFSGISSVMFAGEAGASQLLAPRWRVTLTAHATRFGPEETRGVASGMVFRVLVGGRYDY